MDILEWPFSSVVYACDSTKCGSFRVSGKIYSIKFPVNPVCSLLPFRSYPASVAQNQWLCTTSETNRNWFKLSRTLRQKDTTKGSQFLIGAQDIPSVTQAGSQSEFSPLANRLLRTKSTHNSAQCAGKNLGQDTSISDRSISPRALKLEVCWQGKYSKDPGHIVCLEIATVLRCYIHNAARHAKFATPSIFQHGPN